jgi:DNA modification methylase
MMAEPKAYKAKLADALKPDERNLNRHTQRGQRLVENSQRERGFGRPGFAANDGTVLGGNLSVIEVATDIGLGDGEVFIVETDGNIPIVHLRRDLDPDSNEAAQLAAEDNHSALKSINYDPEMLLAEIERGIEFDGIFEADEVEEILAEIETGETKEDGGAQIDKADELRETWGTALGQVWQLGPHKIACGDCTDKEVVERVMGDERATLLHADPPYGMGKEKDGIANDNLYREKLDVFQLQWWDACRGGLEDNGSVYIWGNAEDLWRLWYVGGLKDRERLTFRNEIVWDKQSGQGMESDAFRMFAPATERCLFFMLGEQGFNINADNYWEGWEPIRTYLKTERDKMGWDNAKCKTLASHSPTSGCHWFDASQWSMPTEDVYNAWKQAAKGQAFKRDYDELKRDFYATRAHFDNAHDLMTDVWQYPRVQGAERWEHATPKPVEMIERVIKSSAPKGGVILSPFLGSGTDLISADRTGRICYGCEIDPGYVAVVLERAREFGISPIERIDS